MSLKPDLVGTASEPFEFTWTPDDVMLYAVSVGAGQDDPTNELELTTENTDGTTLQVLPSYANIITRGARVDFGDYDKSKLVHAEQSFQLHRPLPTSGRARTVATVASVLDKGSGALVRTEAQTVDAESGAPLATTAQTVFIKGKGGFGGERGSSTTWPAGDGPADEEISFHTRPEQALLYRLTGDRNPLHSDPAFAARGGFDRPILHGMCTYGFTTRALVRALCGGDTARLSGMDARFTTPVLPGDTLVVQIWRDGDDAYFRTLRDGEPVIDRGRATLRP